jgi:lipoprotein-releasing system permease protein
MSRLPFELMLALRYLRPKRTFVSIITLICVIGVTLGVAVLIIVLSVMSGFDHDLREKIFGFNAHVTISTTRHRLADWEKVAAIVSSNSLVKGVAPFVMNQVFVATEPREGDAQFAAQMLRGVDQEREGSVSVLPKSVVSGEYNLRGNRVLLGRVFAQELGLFPGDRISIYSPRDLQKMKRAREKNESEVVVPGDYQVAGIFDVGHYEFNAGFVITSLATAQDLSNLDEDVNGLKVMLHDPTLADEARIQFARLLGPDVYISTWFEESSTFLDAIIVEKNVMFYILFFIMIVAAFGITSAQITFVVQKTREIGMLKALGATGRQIMSIFILQSFIVGVLGVVCGVGLGVLGVIYRNDFLHLMRRLFNFELFPQSIYMFSELPALINMRDVILICGGSLFISLLAGLLPAWSAGRLKPVEALRHE